jgi:opacity protein-like surface antigen
MARGAHSFKNWTMRKLTFLIALLVALPAAAQSQRSDRWEIYLGPIFTDGKNYSFEGGTTAKTDTGVGLNFGFGKNLDRHLLFGMDFTWSEQDYRATVQPGPGNILPAGTINGTIETSTLRFFGTYHFLSGNFTPLVSGGLGWTYVDTNIPSGLPENICWAYPWYGYYCSTYVPTHSTTRFSYNLALGLRLDAGKGVFRFIVNNQWVDFGGSYGSSDVLQYRLDLGTKF